MDIRERLIELLAPTSLEFEEAEYLADYLVKNGVTALALFMPVSRPDSWGSACHSPPLK